MMVRGTPVRVATMVLAMLGASVQTIKVPDSPSETAPGRPVVRMAHADAAATDLQATTAAQRRATLDRMLATSDSECDLCHGEQDWVFILATGRSGSTTALEMLNAIPGFYLGGENYGVMNYLLDLYETKPTVEPKSENHMICALQTFARTIIGEFDHATTQVIGFKEIRHVENRQLAFLRTVFPCGKFIVNTRKNLGKQHESQFQKDIIMSDLRNWTDTLDSWQAAHPEDTYMLKLEDYSVDLYNGLLEFLGVRDCKYTTVAHANDGWKWNDDTQKSKDALQGTCKLQHWAAKGTA